MITTVLQNLPAFVRFEKCTFQLVITIEEGKTATLAYIITDAVPGSKHYQEFQETGKFNNSKALFSKKLIKTEADLRNAIREAREYIKINMPQFLVMPKKGYILVV